MIAIHRFMIFPNSPISERNTRLVFISDVSFFNVPNSKHILFSGQTFKNDTKSYGIVTS